jgi:hypothetical protein
MAGRQFPVKFSKLFVKKMLVFVKFFQGFLWRFCLLSRGYEAQICKIDFFHVSKFLDPGGIRRAPFLLRDTACSDKQNRYCNKESDF